MNSSKAIVFTIVALLLGAGIGLAGSQGSAAWGELPLFAIAGIVIYLVHWLVFIPSWIYQTEHYFDLTGSITYLSALGTVAILHPALDTRGLVLCLLIAIWAIRLGSFLFKRVKRAGGDSRFDPIKINFFRFLLTWTLSGTWVYVTMAAGLAAVTSADSIGLDAFFAAGLALWLAGFAFEVTADTQKTRFRADPANEGKFISSGLWSISRHPNYFGEIVLWIGIAVIAFPALSGSQYITLISPVFVIFLLTRVSGINMLERAGKQRWGDNPDYQAYLDSTPALVPLVGKKGD
ncbi:MAG: DUF1295 domain-containing protein [Gammaproteobacteria bacterium]|nr:DUF1295 domain-containing protein [Gammaproteobacteria bacterium]MXX07399.1 DUF1295 domain-containing protein [Gammaproteobacteria bacterium]MYE30171.1 DUF1295 domain-containing protein [Gammaproteobacteria bacterium]MYE99266.1 DUF1295 domain-containing protein [Gammaproteobacteria bacterium]MYI01626.1 DUF1295 domain-containing protein [Gammaproteobacteria bacterium]